MIRTTRACPRAPRSITAGADPRVLVISHGFGRRLRLARWAALLLGLLAILGAACSAPQEPEQLRLARQYFQDNNASARQGPRAQENFFRQTQHPEFTEQDCTLGDMTVDLDPALSTLRPDPAFSPTGFGPPSGNIWVVGVEVTTRRDGAIVGKQIGSQHLVLLNERVYGFAPCPS